VEDFLTKLAIKMGKLIKGGDPNLNNVAVQVINDWQRVRACCVLVCVVQCRPVRSSFVLCIVVSSLAGLLGIIEEMFDLAFPLPRNPPCCLIFMLQGKLPFFVPPPRVVYEDEEEEAEEEVEDEEEEDLLQKIQQAERDGAERDGEVEAGLEGVLVAPPVDDEMELDTSGGGRGASKKRARSANDDGDDDDDDDAEVRKLEKKSGVSIDWRRFEY
jgi:hypothetical protein